MVFLYFRSKTNILSLYSILINSKIDLDSGFIAVSYIAITLIIVRKTNYL